jgi:hypothetical protein
MAGYIGSNISVTAVSAETDSRYVIDPNDVITVSGSNVGVGTSSPNLHGWTTAVTLNTSSNGGYEIGQSGTKYGAFALQGDGRVQLTNFTANPLTFQTNNTERVRIDSSGNLLVGKTSASKDTVGAEMKPDGRVNMTGSSLAPALMNRKTSDGDIAIFQKDGSTVGSIGCISGGTYIGTGDTGLFFEPVSNQIRPFNTATASARDNAIDLGNSGARFDDIYASNGTIQTSDRNEKQDIEALSDAEQRVAVAAKGLLRKYRWKDAVAEKGDAARIHFGIIAQDLQAAFEAEGLDAGRYGMFISSTWWEAEVEKTREVEQEDGTTVTETYTATETYDEPTEGAVERTRMGVRYPELLAFIIAAL